MKGKKILYTLTAVTAMCFVSACDDNDNDRQVVTPPAPPAPVNYSYEVSVSNLTEEQPMSPVAVLLHNEGKLFEVGTSASVELETMAESGDNSGLLGLSVALSAESGAAPIPPGMNETITVTITDTVPTFLSVATMLVNTNDAFTGINAMDISALAVDESIMVSTRTYDSGTEKNTEWATTIPGPITNGEGEGFNAERDDVADVVAMHPGVVSQDDGLAMSVLTQAHRFDNPTLAIKVTRVE